MTNNSNKTGPGGDQDNAREEAIAWAVRLASGRVAPADRQAFQNWLAQSPENEQAWRLVQGVDDAFASLPAGAGTAARLTLEQLDSQRRSRRSLLKMAVAGALLWGAGWTWRKKPWQQQWTMAAGEGKRTHMLLPDGSRIDLNRGSRVSVLFSPLNRRILLESGEIYINTGADGDAPFGHRAFRVEAGPAVFEALGTAFNLRLREDGSRLYVNEGRVAVCREGTSQKVVSAREGVLVPHSGPIRYETPAYDPGAWTKGALIARKMRLADLVAELSGYDSRTLVCSKEAADLKVSGVFQLDGPAPATRALASLSRALPIELVEKGDTLTILPASP